MFSAPKKSLFIRFTCANSSLFVAESGLDHHARAIRGVFHRLMRRDRGGTDARQRLEALEQSSRQVEGLGLAGCDRVHLEQLMPSAAIPVSTTLRFAAAQEPAPTSSTSDNAICAITSARQAGAHAAAFARAQVSRQVDASLAGRARRRRGSQ
jgi:hypothetical protein